MAVKALKEKALKAPNAILRKCMTNSNHFKILDSVILPIVVYDVRYGYHCVTVPVS